MIAQELDFLKRPKAYGSQCAAVEVIETHMAWVFLAGEYAYKVKKPVKLPFLDFSTVERRREDCLLEVSLNRRMADGVYFGIVPLTITAHNRMQLGGCGEVIDWLVHMRRLPRDKMLDDRIRQGRSEVRTVAKVLTDFYMRTAPEPLLPERYVSGLRRDLRRNREALLEPSYRLSGATIRQIFLEMEAFVAREARLLGARAQEGHVLEGHGDLRPEHICLEDRPVIFDCLEFCRAFRVLDTADELSFLSMECDRIGAPFVGPELFETYRRLSGDDPPGRLLAFYRMHRACLRAKLAVWHLNDHPSDPRVWIETAGDYLRLAGSYVDELRSRPQPAVKMAFPTS